MCMHAQGIQASLDVDTPELWAVEEVAAPITERLRAHFAAGRPTDRADRPEWLFETALRLVRQLAPATAPLQAALEVHGLGQVYHVPLEFARAIRNAVKVGPLWPYDNHNDNVLLKCCLPRFADFHCMYDTLCATPTMCLVQHCEPLHSLLYAAEVVSCRQLKQFRSPWGPIFFVIMSRVFCESMCSQG